MLFPVSVYGVRYALFGMQSGVWDVRMPVFMKYSYRLSVYIVVHYLPEDKRIPVATP